MSARRGRTLMHNWAHVFGVRDGIVWVWVVQHGQLPGWLRYDLRRGIACSLHHKELPPFTLPTATWTDEGLVLQVHDQMWLLDADGEVVWTRTEEPASKELPVLPLPERVLSTAQAGDLRMTCTDGDRGLRLWVHQHADILAEHLPAGPCTIRSDGHVLLATWKGGAAWFDGTLHTMVIPGCVADPKPFLADGHPWAAENRRLIPLQKAVTPPSDGPNDNLGLAPHHPTRASHVSSTVLDRVFAALPVPPDQALQAALSPMRRLQIGAVGLSSCIDGHPPTHARDPCLLALSVDQRGHTWCAWIYPGSTAALVRWDPENGLFWGDTDLSAFPRHLDAVEARALGRYQRPLSQVFRAVYGGGIARSPMERLLSAWIQGDKAAAAPLLTLYRAMGWHWHAQNLRRMLATPTA